MIAKSPCINVCKLDPNSNLCEGCLRTSEEISNWSKYSDNKKKNIIAILKNRKLTTLIVLFLIFFNECFSNELWVGKWEALDKWQSEFLIEINDDGTALTNYGNGEKGNWTIVDGNLQIIWESGTKDYIFNGVMGYQRLSKSRNDSYTSGMKKLFD